jgi:hypothetical protein
MIKRMIKPAVRRPQPCRSWATTVERAPDIPSGDALGELARGTAATPNSGQQISRQQRIVHGVLPGAVLAARVGWVVQPVRSCRAE